MFNNTLYKLSRFAERNGGSIIKALARRYLALIYTKPFVRRLVSPLYKIRQPERWIFLVGCYNSGTTILRDILGTHPEVSSLPREGVVFTSLLPRPEERGWTRMWIGCPEHMKMPNECSSSMAETIARDWSPWWKKSARYFLEKSITNVTRMEWIDCSFQNVYFIGITRNAYPVVEGIRRRASPKGEARAEVGSETYPIDMAAKQWVDANKRLFESAPNVNHFLHVRYEDLVENPVVEIERLCAYLGLSPIDIRYHGSDLLLNGRRIRLMNMNRKSIERLSDVDFSRINPIIEQLQRSLEYEIIIK